MLGVERCRERNKGYAAASNSRQRPACPPRTQFGNSNGGGPFGGSQARDPSYQVRVRSSGGQALLLQGVCASGHSAVKAPGLRALQRSWLVPHERRATPQGPAPQLVLPPLPAPARPCVLLRRQAWLYDPYAPAGGRFKRMASSNTKRLYHSTAMLMPDGNVLVMGSEQGAHCASLTSSRIAAPRFSPEIVALRLSACA